MDFDTANREKEMGPQVDGPVDLGDLYSGSAKGAYNTFSNFASFITGGHVSLGQYSPSNGSQAVGLNNGAALLGAAGFAVGARTPSINAQSRFVGYEKPWLHGATPNSVYTHVHPGTGRALQNAIYDSNGSVIGHVDFKAQHGQPSGHGHSFPVPGNPFSGHHGNAPTIAPNAVPNSWGQLPHGMEPMMPIGAFR